MLSVQTQLWEVYKIMFIITPRDNNSGTTEPRGSESLVLRSRGFRSPQLTHTLVKKSQKLEIKCRYNFKRSDAMNPQSEYSLIVTLYVFILSTISLPRLTYARLQTVNNYKQAV